MKTIIDTEPMELGRQHLTYCLTGRTDAGPKRTVGNLNTSVLNTNSLNVSISDRNFDKHTPSSPYKKIRKETQQAMMSSNRHDDSSLSIDIKDLKKSKDDLDKNFSKYIQKSSGELDKSLSPAKNKIEMDPSSLKEISAKKDSLAVVDPKSHIHAHDFEDEEEEPLCFICFANVANVVLLDCGHGGICLECAMDTIKRNNICTLCRSPVSQIIEIESKECGNGMFKVIDSYYVSKQEVEQPALEGNPSTPQPPAEEHIEGDQQDESQDDIPEAVAEEVGGASSEVVVDGEGDNGDSEEEKSAEN